MSTLIRCYPGDGSLDFVLVVTLGVALASSAAWLLSRRLAGKAALRHLVLFSALICCLASPALAWFCAAAGLTLVSIPILPGEQGGMPSGVPQIETDPVWMPPRQSTDPPPVAAGLPLPHTNTTIDQSADVAVPAAANECPATSMPSAPDVQRTGSLAGTLLSFRGIATGAMFVWAAGALLMLARLARNCRRVVLLRRSSRPVQSEQLQALLSEIAVRLGTRQVPLLLVSSRAVTPLAVGFGRPAVILPERLLGAVSDNELRDVLMHEAAHLQRGDQRIVLLQELAGALYWPIVSVHALNRELRRAREEVCDNIVLAGRNAISYGETLLHVAALLVNARPMRAAVGIIGGPGKLERRISGLIDPRRNTMTKIGRKTACVVVLLFSVVGAGASAARFAALAAPVGDGPQPDTKPPPVTTATGAERSDTGQVEKAARKKDSKRTTLEAEAHGPPDQDIIWGYRHRRAFRFGGSDPYESSLIGGLVQNNWWRKWLGPLLAPAQASAINKLDALVTEALDHGSKVAADYMDTNPPDWQEFHARLQRRLRETVRHAERMVALGLLTEPQAELVMQKYLTGSNRLSVLYDETVRELLGMTESQKEELVKIGKEATRRDGLLYLTAKTSEEVGKQYAAIREEAEAAAWKTLTPRQRDMWSRLTAERSLPAKPPDLPALSEAEAARIKIQDVSPVFRVLAEKADAFELSDAQKKFFHIRVRWRFGSGVQFELSDAQKKFLHRLEEITREGLYWISLRKSKVDRVSQARAEFVKHAEQVALLGILTEKQAEQVKAAIK